jgi:signal transduction histidine kinase
MEITGMEGLAGRKNAWRYGLAIASVLLALGIQHALGVHLVGTEPLFYAAVMISAYVGGLGPGLVATALAALCTAYFFLDPPGFLIEGDDIVRCCVFIAVAVLISSLHSRSRRSEQDLRRAEQEAVAANHAKDRFLAVVSHELRNPLFPVLSLSSLHEHDPALPVQMRSDMALIRRSAELEARLIEDLLDLSRMTAGKLSLTRQSTDVARVIEDAVAICTAAAKEKGVQVRVELSASRRTIHGDPVRLRQVVWNLLSNAIKFTPTRGSVLVRLGPSPQRADMLEITVRDSGVGIPAERLPHIFDAFEQGGAEVTQRFGGLGLGLAIARALVEAHGGSIEASSEGQGRGSTFTVRLPLAPADAVDAADAPDAVAPAAKAPAEPAPAAAATI